MGEFVRVTGTGDVKPGHGIVAEVNGKILAVFNVDGTFHAIDNTCVHRGGPLGEGDVEGSSRDLSLARLAIRCHHGACVANPAAKVERYEVQVEER